MTAAENHCLDVTRAHQVKILAQREVAPRHFRLTFHCAEIARRAKAGLFVHILPRVDGVFDPLLRRAFSILSTHGDSFDILYRAGGRGTNAMSMWGAGASVSVLGPLGQPFPQLGERSILVGGGVGVPPLAMLASQSHDQNVIALIGARSREDVICLEDFERQSTPVEIATDDGSAGHHGFVTELLERRLEQAAKEVEQSTPTVYSCGPLPMLRRVSAVCEQFAVPCFVSLEEAMPCGVGVCNGCVVPISEQSGSDGYARYRRICMEGPVLDAREVDWNSFHSAC